ncbi:MAG: NUDIX hydrolase [Propionibacteriaceae bacterium]|jgi:ADP-ribose pyrophosphatase|nr:NUDIX hydrolase [Propionibacteriaceae bacterium]
MTLPGPTWPAAEVADQPLLWPAREQARMEGLISTFVTDQVTTPTGEVVQRDWLRHPGAVAVIALDADDRIAVVHQYRHPAGFRLVEAPAGLLDVDHELAVRAAQRELAEEAQLQAADWRVLVDLFTSPGSSQESIRIFLAQDLSPTPRPDGFVVEGEEADMALGWARVDDVIDAVLNGRVQSPTLIAGVLALQVARTAGGFDRLRLATAPWPARQVKHDRDLADAAR